VNARRPTSTSAVGVVSSGRLHLAKVRVAGSSPVVRSNESDTRRPRAGEPAPNGPRHRREHTRQGAQRPVPEAQGQPNGGDDEYVSVAVDGDAVVTLVRARARTGNRVPRPRGFPAPLAANEVPVRARFAAQLVALCTCVRWVAVERR